MKGMKKILVGVLSLACVFATAVGLTACADGKDGVDGKSAYEIWLDNGYSGTEMDFLEWLKGEVGQQGNQGEEGKSAYQTWLENGHSGTEADFLEWLKGDSGVQQEEGTDGLAYYPLPDGTYAVAQGNTTYLDEIVIPSIYKGKAVTVVVEYGFETSKAQSITIPDSVTSIGAQAFAYCSSLTEMTLPFVGVSKDGTSNTHFGYIFGASSSSYNDGYVPTSLKKVTITSVTSIAERAFYWCSSLTSVVIPDSVTSIGERAFSDCWSLTSIEIPDGVTSIGNYAFQNCSSLTSVEIPDSVTSIGNYAFQNCSSLTSVYITDIVAWCAISFDGYFANPLCHANNLYLNNGLVTELVIPDSVTSIGDSAFSSCDSLTGVVIPDSVTSIGEDAFRNCSNLTSVVIPDSVTSIGNSAFYYCDSLTSVYYKGSASDWSEISIDSGNSKLTSATRYYYSESQPTTSGNYWHYDENGEVAVW